jgi:transketolase
MGAAMNGMSVSKLRPFGGTFFNFSDYERPTIRLAALMETPVIHVFTHDSIGLGEDGPTHQPIEQLAALRAIPNIVVLRPGDANEVVEAWKLAVEINHGPVLLVLTRQAVPTLDRNKYASAAGVAKGAYILADAPGGKPQVILMATGSEVPLTVDAYEKLKSDSIQARVVSMPSWELFEKQDQAYKDSVLPPAITARVSVEMASTFGWERYVGPKGQMVGMHTFGASAPWKDLQKHFGFTTDAVVAAARKAISISK